MKLGPAALLFARKDLSLFFRDRTAMLLGFLLPATLVTIFGYLMGMMNSDNGTGPMARATLWVTDVDQTEDSRSFYANLRTSELLRVRPRLNEDGTYLDTAFTAEQLREKVIDGKFDHALIIGKGFAEALASAEALPLTLVRDPGSQMEGQLTNIAVMQSLNASTEGRIFTNMLVQNLRNAGMPDVAVDQIRAVTEQQRALLQQSSGNQSFNMMNLFSGRGMVKMEDHVPPERADNVSAVQAQAVGGIAVMMLLFGLTAASASLLREREGGTMRRLLSLPIPPGSILLGKALAMGVVGLIQLTVLFVVGEFLFEIGIWRDPLTLGAIIVCTIAAAVAFGLLIASWARTPKQADGMSTLVILVMSCLGGSWFPLQTLDLPMPMNVAMHLTINHWSVSSFQNLFWRTKSLADTEILLALGVLLLFTVLASWQALRLFRKRYLEIA